MTAGCSPRPVQRTVRRTSYVFVNIAPNRRVVLENENVNERRVLFTGPIEYIAVHTKGDESKG